jgi:hypothetical protein
VTELILNVCAVSLVVAMTIAAMIAIGIMIYGLIKLFKEVLK